MAVRGLSGFGLRRRCLEGAVLLTCFLGAAAWAQGSPDDAAEPQLAGAGLRSAIAELADRGWAAGLPAVRPGSFLAGQSELLGSDPLLLRDNSTAPSPCANCGVDGPYAPQVVDYFLLVLKLGAAIVWVVLLFWLSTKGFRDQECEAFLRFETHAQILARSQLNGTVSRLSLRFLDPEMELRYKDIWRELVVSRLKGLCIICVLFIIMLVSFSTSADKTGFNPAWSKWTTSRAALTHNTAAIVIIVLAIIMLYAVTWKRDMMESEYLDFIISTWVLTVAILGGLFISRWTVCKLHGEETLDVFGSKGFDEEYVFGLIGISLYLNVFTPIRFCVCMPICTFLPTFYTMNLIAAGLPEDTGTAPVVAIECCGMLSLISLSSLVGKYLSESDRRTNFLRMHHAYTLEQELTTDKEEGSTPMLQARSALLKAVEALQVIQETPGIAELIGRQVQTAKDRVIFAHHTIGRADNLFDVDADEIVNKASMIADHETKEFIKTAFLDVKKEPARDPRLSRGGSMRPTTSRDGTLRRSWLAKNKSTLGSAGPLHSEDVRNSVAVVAASKWAGSFGASWDFDALEVAKLTGNCSVIFAGERALVDGVPTIDDDSQPKDVLSVGKDIARRWIREIHSRYQPNAYHNETHAATVAHICVYLAHVSGWAKLADPVQLCSLVIAAFAHDVGHFGRNNMFCNKSWNTQSLIWNDRSVLENMHAAILFSMTTGPADIFDCLDTESRTSMRQMILRFILATDIKEHFSFMSKLHSASADPKFLVPPSDDDEKKVHDQFEDNVIMGGELLIKTADIAHSLLPWKMHREWSFRVNIEFWEQGDEEQALGLPISPLCDRRDVKLASGQNFFIREFGMKMLTESKKMMKPDSPHLKDFTRMLEEGENNVLQWKAEEKTVDPITLSLAVIREKFGQPASEVYYPYQFDVDQTGIVLSTQESVIMAASTKPARYCKVPEVKVPELKIGSSSARGSIAAEAPVARLSLIAEAP